MTLFQSFVLGIIEGVTEFLPISSTGHMILVAHFMHITQSVTRDTFEIVVQLGAILAVVVTYHKKLKDLELWKKLLIAFIPTGFIGVLAGSFIKHLLDSSLVVAITMLIGGVIILLVEKRYSRKEKAGEIHDIHTISYKDALILGLCQAVAIIPGTSRSGAVIVGGLLRNLPRKLLVEFSFLLAVPTMVVATLYTLVKKHSELSLDSFGTIVFGTFIAFVVAFLIIRLALNYIRRHSFNIFGWYRIIVGTLLLLILLF